MSASAPQINPEQLRRLLLTNSLVAVSNNAGVQSTQAGGAPSTAQVQLVNPSIPSLPVANGMHLTTFSDGSKRLVQVALGRVVRMI